MADKETGGLTAASAVTGADIFHGVQAGNSRKFTADQIRAYTLQPVAVGTFSETAPTASQILLDWLAVESVTFADDFAGSQASVGTNPTASFAMDVKKNGVSVGTITISTGGVATFVTAGTTVALVAGDLLTVTAPSSADATIARLRLTLKGTRS